MGANPSVPKARSFRTYGDGKLPIVHPRDIVAVGVRALRAEGYEGKVSPLTGPEARSVGEQVKILSDGQQLEYVSITAEAARKGMDPAGMPFLIAAIWRKPINAGVSWRSANLRLP
jgi:uncharacterized protein YbjT (DUF2867 family)